MPLNSDRLIAVVAFIAVALSVAAQDAHPLTGNWIGSWGPTPDHRNRVLLTMEWEGQQIRGTVNPGSDDLPFTRASLDPSDWSVRFEVDARDARGNAVTYVIEGHIEDLGSPHRSIVGTWSHGQVTGDFEVTRQ